MRRVTRALELVWDIFLIFFPWPMPEDFFGRPFEVVRADFKKPTLNMCFRLCPPPPDEPPASRVGRGPG